MKVFEKGKGAVNLSKNTFVASGGEGEVYAKGDTAYKIYKKPEKMIHVAKIQELSVIKEPKVIRPLTVLLNSRNKPVGYTMRYIEDTHSLCQLFTKSFKDRHNLTPNIILKLVRDMQNTIKKIHDNKILIVDLNEMNFLIDKNFREVYFIDVDSYQTPSYPATAIMESIRDRQNKTFDKNTDWFSFAIVSFQLFIGIHPFKGKHIQTKNYPFDDRMRDNISVFNSNIKIPKLCPPLDIIPDVYRDWYFKVFEEGLRCPPPFDLHATINVVHKIKKIVGDDIFNINEIATYDSTITFFYSDCASDVVKLEDGTIIVNKQKFPNKSDSFISFTEKFNYFIESRVDKGKLVHKNLSKVPDCQDSLIYPRETMTYKGRLLSLSEGNVLEFDFMEMRSSILPSPKVVGNVLDKSSKMYDGIVIQNLLGTYYASIFPNKEECYQVKLEDLTNLKIVDAKFDSCVIMVISSDSKGVYSKHIYSLDKEFRLINTRTVNNISIINLNFVTLDNGVVAHINDKENLELFTANKPNIKEIESNAISSDMALTKRGTKVLFYKGKSLYSLEMK
jgi:serine/threonine protein kinase